MSADQDLDRLIREARPTVPVGFASAVAQKVAVQAAAKRAGRRLNRRVLGTGAVILAAAAAILVFLFRPSGDPVSRSSGWIVDGERHLSRGTASVLLMGEAAVTTDQDDLILQRGQVQLSGPAAVVTPWARVVAIGDTALVDVKLDVQPEPQEKAMTTVKLGALAAVAAGSVLTVTVIRGTADVRPAAVANHDPVTLAAGESLTLPNGQAIDLIADGKGLKQPVAGTVIARQAPAGAAADEPLECAGGPTPEGCPGCGEAPEECGGCQGCPGMAVDVEEPKQVDIDIDGSPAMGKSDARVVIVEFGDYQCQFCEQAMSTIHELADLYPNDVRVVFKNFPMPGHKAAPLAAEAALAAGAQGKFWEMHDLLYANRTALDRGSLDVYAKQLGLDLVRFGRDLDEHTFAPQVERDTASAMAAGIKGIPTFFINGRVVVGVRPLDVLKGIVDEELARVQ
jgi:protein-disulfide isomerase